MATFLRPMALAGVRQVTKKLAQPVARTQKRGFGGGAHDPYDVRPKPLPPAPPTPPTLSRARSSPSPTFAALPRQRTRTHTVCARSLPVSPSRHHISTRIRGRWGDSEYLRISQNISAADRLARFSCTFAISVPPYLMQLSLTVFLRTHA
eukprot:SAG31_NODE_8934_length_1361_cov_1.301109_1_plen_150_part_00